MSTTPPDPPNTIALRRLGAGRVHRARVPARLLSPASVFGAPCTAVAAPVVALCGATLRGALVLIPEGESFESWRASRSICGACEHVLRLAPEAWPAAETSSASQPPAPTAIVTMCESSPAPTPCPECGELLDVAGAPFTPADAPGFRFYACPHCESLVSLYSAAWLS